MEETEELRAARAMRRAALGDAYVDGMTADRGPVAAEFQDYLTSIAWGVWVRGGALSRRDRSLLVLAMTAALGRMDEFGLHASSTPRTGVTDEEVADPPYDCRSRVRRPLASRARTAEESVDVGAQVGRVGASFRVRRALRPSAGRGSA
jgi:4-carboxymuconolactone decarboxylase